MLGPQLKRGLLEVCVLSAIQRQESYGYKIIKDISGCIKISESTLYPILKRLEANGEVTVRAMEHNGRLRKLFTITGAGRKKISDFLTSWEEMDRIYKFVKETSSDEQK
ncbi:MAG: PadR family transcriptional regulator [Oscillospiraceae bacterium]|nr:PadR family transcriptional regulator [Oscillospiraceae bacterium]